jgi:hypothetical protein
MPSIAIPEFYQPALAKIASMSEGEVEQLRSALEKARPTPNPEVLVANVRLGLKVDFPDLHDIIQALASMRTAISNGRTSVEAFAQDVARSFPDSKQSKKAQEGLRKRLIALLTTEPLALSAKAGNVQHHYERLFASARIVTDLRPVFFEDRTEVAGTMIVHNLSITYLNRGHYQDEFFALDGPDLKLLRKILDRAELKAEALKKLAEETGTTYLEDH